MKATEFVNSTIVIVILVVAGCDSKQASNPQATGKGPADLNIVTLDPAMIEKIKIGYPEMIDIADRLQVPGRIQVNEHDLLFHVSTYLTGRITEVHVMLGDKVEAGTLLARISSPGLTQAQLTYLNASSQVRLAEKVAGRADLLLDADVIAVAEVERRESELQIARAELEAARDHLRLLGVDSHVLKEIVEKGHILPSTAITASGGGIVIERHVVIGQVVKPGDKLFKVANLSSVWAVGAVAEQIVPNVEVGQHVEVHVPSLGDESFDGFIIFIADMVDPLTRTVEVKTEMNNPQRRLKPAMLATMHITNSPQITLVVPKGAVVREDDRDYVFLVQGDSRFQRVPVELAPEVANMRPLLKGLTVEQRIIVDGAMELNSVRKLAEFH